MTSRHASDLTAPLLDGVPLSEFLTNHFPGFSPSTRKDWVRAAARFCRHCHDSGLEVGPSFTTNSSQPWTFSHAGPPDMPAGSPLAQGQRWFDLAAMLSESFQLTRRSDRFLFLREYLQDGRRFKAMRPSLIQLEEAALDTAALQWRQRETECLRPGAGFIVERSGYFRIIRRSDAEAEAAVAALLPDPDRLLRAGEGRSDRGSGCVSSKVELGGQPYFLKRYDCRGLGYRLKNAFRRSRALRAWLATWGLKARSVAVPEPLVLLEERHFLLLGRSYILSSFHEEGERLMTLWPRLNGEEKRRTLARCAILLGRIHAMNMIHGDTNWDNILVYGSAAAPRLMLVDLDGCRPLRQTSTRQAIRDISHFVRDLFRERIQGEHLVGFFLERWIRWLRPRQKRRVLVPLDRFRQEYRGLK